MSTARVVLRSAMTLIATLALTVGTASLAGAATGSEEINNAPVHEASLNLGMAYGGPVGLVTVILGLGGLILGVLRRRKVSRKA
ncbi:hypothetical protein [Actinoalloteichus hymeniacidonis]|uniref:Uncharacterized protein n=1 Tax=Actinoalloteichus hymeniacidonis TaxID=340345 RepID=A0AAC9N0J5_9PSEU|nr:hypothetical protein [Actinoalloteichus hymeniacidonis]AOS65669.1 hypothetical protein TL08_24455 [Actinoalloteichus hymeniacidonis]MBB5906241.1 hypothetical protein [Actinoalloteichus hymeniacidonis]